MMEQAKTRRISSKSDIAAKRARRWRRFDTAFLALIYTAVLVTGVLVWEQNSINWNMQLAPSGPQVVHCASSSCAAFGWQVASETIGGNAANSNIAIGNFICAYVTSNHQIQLISSSTSSRDITGALGLVVLAQNQTCNQQSILSLSTIAPLPAVIDFAIAVICAILATLIFLYATQRSLAIHTVAFLSTLTVAFGWLPSATVEPLLMGSSEAIAASYLLPPLLATLLWRLLFPTNTNNQRYKMRYLVSLFFILVGVGGILSFFRAFSVFTQDNTQYFVAQNVSGIFFAIDVVVALGVVLISNLSRQSSVRRDYARILGTGTVVALLPIFVFAVLPQIIQRSVIIDPSLAAITAIALPLSLAYVVLRRDLLGVTSLVRTTTERSLRILSLAFVAALILSVVAVIFSISTETAVGIFVALFFIALFSPAIQGGATWLTEHWIFPEVNRYRGILSRASAATVKAGIAEPHEIANEMIGEVKLALPVRQAALYVGNKQTGQFIRVIDDTDPNAYVTIFDSNHPVPELLRSRGGVINQGDLHEIRQRMTIALMTVPGVAPDIDPAAGWDTFVPIMLRDELIAILVLGERDDEFEYSSTDRALLLTLSNRRALALDYARVVADLRVAYEQQKELDEMKDQFIMTAHHELRTPLTGLLGYVELLRDMGEEGRAETPVDVEYFLNSASKAGEDLADLMTALLQADQKNINRTKLHPVLMDVSIALQAVANSVDMSFNRKNHRITVRCDQHLKAWADPQALSRVLTNLLSNAIKYSPEQSPVLITAHRRPDVEAIEIIVRDWGSGIPAEEQRKVFERFVRLERDLNSPVRGSGLGLYVARTLIESMGGRIWVESSGQSGMGTTFRIVLPIAPPPGQAVEEERPVTQPHLARQPAPFTPIQQMDTDPRLKTLAPTKRRLDGEFHFPNDTPGFP